VLLSIKKIDVSDSVTPVEIDIQFTPPFVVFNNVPLEPTDHPVLAFLKLTDQRFTLTPA
jgi:hypothetical protein